MHPSTKLFGLIAVTALAIVLYAVGRGKWVQSAYSCSGYAGTYQVEYVGHAIGKGRLALATVPQREEILEGRLSVWDETGTEAGFDLIGPGSCEKGIVTLRFGSGDHPNSRVRVLGGTATIVAPRGRVETLFGIWSATAVLKDNGVQKTLSGFFRETRSIESSEVGASLGAVESGQPESEIQG